MERQSNKRDLANRPGASRLAAILGLSLIAAPLLVSLFLSAGASRAQSRPRGWMGSPNRSAISGDPIHGQRIAQERCAACHGADGNSTDLQFPKLAGQSLPYLYWELRAFKRGIRRSDVMAPNLVPLSYADLADVAAYFSRQRRRPDQVPDNRLAAVGERLFYSGMPSCAMCHNAAGTGGMPMGSMMGGGMMRGGMMGMMGPGMANVPSLNGQHPAYIVGQLDRFASGERQGSVMNRIAGTLGQEDKRAIAAFLSGSP